MLPLPLRMMTVASASAFAYLFAACFHPQAARADQYYDYGVQLFGRRDYKNAIRYFDMRLRVSPKDAMRFTIKRCALTT